MNFNQHYKQRGLHAVFSPSQCSWLRYDDEKALSVYVNKQASERGSRLHAWAKETIDLGIKQPKSKKTLYMYVNDAIGYKMDTEVVLYYSDRFFGTADAICFRKNFLRIHDLKTGENPAHLELLELYAPLFCLEYMVKPETIEMELRLYQNNEVIYHNPDPKDIRAIMNHIVHLDQLLSDFEAEEV